MKKIWSQVKNQVHDSLTLLELRPVALVETVIVLTIMVVFDLVFGRGNRFLDFQTHPFWFIILIVSVQYGVKEGVISVFFATLFLYVGNWPRQSIDIDYYEHIAVILRLPVLWFAMAAILGLISERRIREKHRLIAEVEESHAREKTIARAYQDLKEAKETIEIRLVGQLRSSTVAYKALQAIGTLDPNEVLLNIDELINTVMRPRKMSVFGVGEQGFEVVSSQGWESKEDYSLRIDKSSRLYQALLSKKKVLCIVNEDDEEILESEGVLAAPLVTPDTGQIFGAIKIEEMEFENITLSNIETFTVLCEWIALAYANAKKAQGQSEGLTT